MSVKTIFKTLIGTIFLMISISAIIELFNVHISGMQIRQMTKMAANQACTLFTQETYKTDGSKGATKLSDVKDNMGNTYVTGKFYGNNTDAYDIWHYIYDNDNFKTFLNSTGAYNDNKPPAGKSSMKDAFPELEILLKAVESKGKVNIGAPPSWDASEEELLKYTNLSRQLTYYETMFTPVNIGIPYMDDEVVNKMFQWNLAQLLSNCDPDLIQTDVYGDKYVNYKGFRCYVQKAEIVDYRYEVFDLNNNDDKVAFETRTGMKASQLGIAGNSSVDLGSNYKSLWESNNYVTIVGINYRIPISYAGITPIKRIFNYAWRNEVDDITSDYVSDLGGVDGFNGQGYNPSNYVNEAWANEKLSSVASGVDSARDGIEFLEAGGITDLGTTAGAANNDKLNASGVLDTLGELTYILVR